MSCACHGEPAYWHKDPRAQKGGKWRCSVRKRDVARTHRDVKNAGQRARYDRDPIHRIEKNLHDHARRRRQTITRRREAHVSEQGSA